MNMKELGKFLNDFGVLLEDVFKEIRALRCTVQLEGEKLERLLIIEAAYKVATAKVSMNMPGVLITPKQSEAWREFLKIAEREFSTLAELTKKEGE